MNTIFVVTLHRGNGDLPGAEIHKQSDGSYLLRYSFEYTDSKTQKLKTFHGLDTYAKNSIQLDTDDKGWLPQAQVDKDGELKLYQVPFTITDRKKPRYL